MRTWLKHGLDIGWTQSRQAGLDLCSPDREKTASKQARRLERVVARVAIGLWRLGRMVVGWSDRLAMPRAHGR